MQLDTQNYKQKDGQVGKRKKICNMTKKDSLISEDDI